MLANRKLLALLQRHAPRVAAPFLSRCQHTAESDAAEVAEFRELVHDFASREIAPHAAEIDKSNTFPHNVDLWTQMGHMGLHGALIAPAEEVWET